MYFFDFGEPEVEAVIAESQDSERSLKKGSKMALNLDKTDKEQGYAVNEHLKKCGVQTPSFESGLDADEKIEKLENLFTEALNTLGLDLTDDSLSETPKRIAKMYVNEIFWGLRYDAFPKCTAVDNKMRYD